MTIWITADLHIGHKNIQIYCDRPMDIDEQLVDNWNKVVRQGDTVWVLGDFIWKDHDHWLPQFNGFIHLIRGNHDHFSKYKRYRMEFHKKSVELNFQELGRVILSHRPNQVTRLLNLCGHIHRLWKRMDNCINVGVDVWNYTPVSLARLEEFIWK